eukprot:Hpha_TRINITY_DN16833_c2_g5::TRINITY_DN16833_c2_g5_i1::g.153566::m.153566/K03347/CUL1, CDC53; cullin 1
MRRAWGALKPGQGQDQQSSNMPAAIPPRRSLRVSPVDFAERWRILHDGLLAVFTLTSKAQSAPEYGANAKALYHAVYELCTCPCYNIPPELLGRGSQYSHTQRQVPLPHVVYKQLRLLMDRHTISLVQRADRQKYSGSELLGWYTEAWRAFTVSLEFANAVGKYLNGDAIQKEIAKALEKDDEKDKTVHTVHSLGLLAWRDHMLAANAGPLARALLDEIDKERRAMITKGAERRCMTDDDKRIVRTVLESMIAVGVDGRKQKSFYAENFELRFLKATETFYRTEIREQLQRLKPGDQLSEYMCHVEQRIEQESRRARDCMEQNTEKSVLKTLTKIAIEDHASELVDASPQWFNEGRIDDQRRLFRLLGRTDRGLEQLRKLLEDRFDAAGKAAVERVKVEAQSNICRYADVLTEMAEECEKVVTEVFQSHQQFKMALTVGCTRFVNRNAMSPTDGQLSATHLAKCANTLLRTGSQTAKRHDDQQLDTALTRLISLIKYLEDKDVFTRVYTHSLARRLISQNYDAAHDRMMIKKLTGVCDWREFTHKLERMLGDVDHSKELTENFGSWVKEKEVLLPELTITVGTFGTWPLAQATKAPYLPEPLNSLRASFLAWYTPQHKGRNLSWHIPHCTVQLRTTYTKQRSYELHASVAQVSLLMQFDPEDEQTLDTLVEAAKLDRPTAVSTLQSLVRQRLLLGPEPAVSTPGDTTYRLNLDFTSGSKKLMLISSQAQRDAQPDEKESMRSAMDDRRFAIQAAIVRVIKSKVQLQHSALVADVTSELLPKFRAAPHDVKVNIDKLIDKEQIERTPDGQGYKYLA